MVLTREERMCPPYRLNRPGGGDTSTWKVRHPYAALCTALRRADAGAPALP
jgi:hypothetical protein